uniref:Uncharacterized protein n=1 Tax=Meloidogyne hapla TaxID=6305 RepID=A0A1I8C1Z9_MELHA
MPSTTTNKQLNQQRKVEYKQNIKGSKIKKLKKNKFQERQKRAINNNLNKFPKNIKALYTLQQQLAKMEWTQNYLNNISKQSASFFEPFLRQSISFVPSQDATEPIISQIYSILNSTNLTNKGMSLFSPRLLSLFPSKKLKRPEFLSPELFSFSGDGFLPLNKLFQILSPNDGSREPMEWIDFILEISGAGKQLKQLLKNPEIKHFNKKIWPVIQLLKQKEELWEKLEKSLNSKQRRELADKGYVNLDRWQLEMFFGKEYKENEWINSNNKLEEKIKLLASLADKEDENDYNNYLGVRRRRRRRDSKRGILDGGSSHELPEPIIPLPPPFPPPLPPLPPPLPLPEPLPPPPPPLPLLPLPEPLPPFPPLPPPLPLPEPILVPVRPHPPPFGGSTVIGGLDSNGEQFLTPWGRSPDTEVNIATVPRSVLLSPWAFQNRFGGVILEGLKVASPSAFIAAILSPLALTARITSPSAFRSQILSPEALSAYLLSPDVFLAEILSPAVMQTRVLSPKALFVQILSPMLASPRLASPQLGGLVVLSPNFLSPRINSHEGLQVEILSPHILGGEHEGLEGDRWTIDGATHYIGFPGLQPINGPF